MIELCFQTEKYILLKKEKRIMFILRCLSSVRFIFLEKPILYGCSNSINPSPASVLGPGSLSCFLLMQQRWMHAGKLRPIILEAQVLPVKDYKFYFKCLILDTLPD